MSMWPPPSPRSLPHTAGAIETATAAPSAAKAGAAAVGATTAGLTTAFEVLVLVGRAHGWAERKGVGRERVARACARGASTCA